MRTTSTRWPEGSRFNPFVSPLNHKFNHQTIKIMEEKKEKRVLQIELDDDVKKVSITGKNGDEQVVMSQELDEDDLDQVAGGYNPRLPYYQFQGPSGGCPLAL